mmetsp:Transcript_24596/g.38190  ORF Transcript_24596/g.38190 Transcript_24596/m.38190 type:complete len:165 (-) Transcript_24596:5305-5799(-)
MNSAGEEEDGKEGESATEDPEDPESEEQPERPEDPVTNPSEGQAEEPLGDVTPEPPLSEGEPSSSGRRQLIIVDSNQTSRRILQESSAPADLPEEESPDPSTEEDTPAPPSSEPLPTDPEALAETLTIFFEDLDSTIIPLEIKSTMTVSEIWSLAKASVNEEIH